MRGMLERADQPISPRPKLLVNELDKGVGGLPARPEQQHCLGSLPGLSFHDFSYLSHGLKLIRAVASIGDDMHGRFLSRGSAAVDPHIVGAVIGSGICGVDAQRDKPTCTAVANLVVDG